MNDSTEITREQLQGKRLIVSLDELTPEEETTGDLDNQGTEVTQSKKKQIRCPRCGLKFDQNEQKEKQD